MIKKVLPRIWPLGILTTIGPPVVRRMFTIASCVRIKTAVSLNAYQHGTAKKTSVVHGSSLVIVAGLPSAKQHLLLPSTRKLFSGRCYYYHVLCVSEVNYKGARGA